MLAAFIALCGGATYCGTNNQCRNSAAHYYRSHRGASHSSSCFRADAKVTMSNGEYRSIASLTTSDTVVVFTADMSPSSRRVARLRVHNGKYTVWAFGNMTTPFITGDHFIHVIGTGWLSVQNVPSTATVAMARNASVVFGNMHSPEHVSSVYAVEFDDYDDVAYLVNDVVVRE